MGLVIYSVIPYMIWLGIDVFRYNKNLKKGKDTFQISQALNVVFSSADLACWSVNVDVSKNMIATMIGFNAIIYVVYWFACFFVRRKYDSSFLSK